MILFIYLFSFVLFSHISLYSLFHIETKVVEAANHFTSAPLSFASWSSVFAIMVVLYDLWVVDCEFDLVVNHSWLWVDLTAWAREGGCCVGWYVDVLLLFLKI